MTTSFVGISSAPVTGTTVTLSTPADTLIGDLLYAIVVTDAAVVVTPPDGTWKPHTTFAFSTLQGVTQFQYASEDGAQSVAFTLSAWTAARYIVIVAYRGTARDFEFDVVNYPYGFFAPSGSIGATSTGSSTTLTSVNGANPHTFVANTRVLYFFAQYDNALGSPIVDDVDPLEPIRITLQTTMFGFEVVDVEYEALVTPPSTLTVISSKNKPWMVFSVAIEPLDPVPESLDNFKSKVLRSLWPPPYDVRLSSDLGKLLTIIGTSDNDLGGLFGSEDFLPDEEP